MKKSYLFGMFALAAMTMVGCSNDEVVNDYSQDNAIEFGTYVGRDVESRGAIITTESLQQSEDGFGVFAYYHQNEYTTGDVFNANFMNNQQVKATFKDETSEDGKTTTKVFDKWEYTPLKYWPNNPGDKVSFIAYAPYHENATFPEKGLLAYEVVADVTQQEDLLWDRSQNFNKTKQDYGIDKKVTFVFGHALSKVDFTISAGVDLTEVGGKLADETTIYVDKVEIIGLNSKGIFDLSKSTATWDGWNTPIDYVWDYVYGNETATELDNNILTGDKGATKKPLLKGNDNYLFAIPQTLPQNFEIKVTYRVFTVDSKLTDTVQEQVGVTGSLITNIISVDASDLDFTEFVAGTQYKFNIILGMTSVKLDVDVDDWKDPEIEKDAWFNENTDI